jgi:hypothetical protein
MLAAISGTISNESRPVRSRAASDVLIHLHSSLGGEPNIGNYDNAVTTT